MPSFVALCCAFCHKYQVQQDKKVKKFTCPCCHQQQSFQRIYAISDKAKDIRLVVQDLNERHFTAVEAQDACLHQAQLPSSHVAPLKQHDPSLWQDYIDEEGDLPEDKDNGDVFVTEAPDLPRPAKRLKQQAETSKTGSKPKAPHAGWHRGDLTAPRQPGQRHQYQQQLPQRQPQVASCAGQGGFHNMLVARPQHQQQKPPLQKQQPEQALAPSSSVQQSHEAGGIMPTPRSTQPASTSAPTRAGQGESRWAAGAGAPSSAKGGSMAWGARGVTGALRDCSNQQPRLGGAGLNPLAGQQAAKQPRPPPQQQGWQQQQQQQKHSRPEQPQQVSSWGTFMEADGDAVPGSDEEDGLEGGEMLVTTID